MKKVLYPLLILATLLFTTPLFAQFNMFIKIAQTTALGGTVTFDGESKDATFAGTIEAQAYSNAIKGCPLVPTSPTSGCKSTLSPFSFQMRMNAALISLKTVEFRGAVIPSVDVWVRKSSTSTTAGYVYYQIRMENVIVSQVSESGGGGDDGISFLIDLSPQKIGWQYTKSTATGTPGTKSTFGWDLSTNAPWTPSTFPLK